MGQMFFFFFINWASMILDERIVVVREWGFNLTSYS